MRSTPTSNRRKFLKGSLGLSGGALALSSAPLFGITVPQTTESKLTLAPDPKRKPVKSKSVYNILDFGAVADGKTLNTDAFSKAIATAVKNGGGQILVPEGVFLTGQVKLDSNIELHLSKNAVVLGSTDIEHYEKTGRGWYALISALEANNVAITGEGTLDGQGLEVALNVRDLHLTGKRESPKFNYRRSRANEAERPQLVEMYKCDEVKIYDVTLKDAGSWVQTYEQCKNLVIDHIYVDSDTYWNNDGIDIDDCEDVRVTNCYVNAADDAICLKSETRGFGNNRVLIQNCRVRSSASGVKFGTSSWGGFKNVTVRDIEVYDTYRSAIALETVDGGPLENVLVENIRAYNTGNAIFIRLGHRNDDAQVSTLKNVVIRDLRAHIPFERPDINYRLRGPALNMFFNPIPASITGIPGHLVENITLEDIHVSYPGRSNKGLAYMPSDRLDWVPNNEKDYPEFSMFGELPSWALYTRHAKDIKIKNCQFLSREPEFRPAFVFDKVDEVYLKNIKMSKSDHDTPVVLNDVKKSSIKKVTYFDGETAKSIEQ